MNKFKGTLLLTLLSIGLVIANAANAGVCNKGSLTGDYNYSLIGVSGTSLHGVGRIYFNGAGASSFSGHESYNGAAYPTSGSGTYTVSASCVAVGAVKWTSGYTTTYRLYLDQMDNVPATRVAYRGTLIAWSNAGVSFSGELNRVIGKF